MRMAKQLVSIMDSKFSLFGIKFGIDPVLNVIPWLGSALGTTISLYLFWIAYRLNVPKYVYLRMFWNIGFDFVLGIIPYAGFVFDLFYRSNLKNYTLIEKYFDPSVLEGEIVN